jgi:hypothetical protein
MCNDFSPTITCQWNLILLLYRLRDELRTLPCTYKCRHDAAADLIHLYAYTKCFFRVRVSESLVLTEKMMVVVLPSSLELTQVWLRAGL